MAEADPRWDDQTDEPATQDVPAADKTTQAASTSAREAGRQLAAGFAAMRDVHDASRRRANAKAQAKALKSELAEDEATLARRMEVERDFDRIVAGQTQALHTAQEDERAAREDAERLDSERATLEAQLTSLKSQHEEQLRPYRKLADTAKGRADDAAVALAEARRAVKAADGRMTDAVRARDQRVQQANRALDSAQGRLHKAQAELDRLQEDDEATPVLLERMRGEVVAESTAIEAARDDVGHASDEAQLAVETAQTHLWTQRQSLEVAERQSESAKAEARARREEYDSLYKKAKAEEDELSSWIRDRKRGSERALSAAKDANARAGEAQAALDEAYEVRATPDVTDALARKIADMRAELERRDEDLSQMARHEHALRKRTRSLRIFFLMVMVAVVLIVGVVVWAIVTRRG